MKYGLGYFTDTHLTIIGLLIFFTFFIGLLWWTSLKPNKALYKQIEQIPLNDGDQL